MAHSGNEPSLRWLCPAGWFFSRRAKISAVKLHCGDEKCRRRSVASSRWRSTRSAPSARTRDAHSVVPWLWFGIPAAVGKPACQTVGCEHAGLGRTWRQRTQAVAMLQRLHAWCCVTVREAVLEYAQPQKHTNCLPRTNEGLAQRHSPHDRQGLLPTEDLRIKESYGEKKCSYVTD